MSIHIIKKHRPFGYVILPLPCFIESTNAPSYFDPSVYANWPCTCACTAFFVRHCDGVRLVSNNTRCAYSLESGS